MEDIRDTINTLLKEIQRLSETTNPQDMIISNVKLTPSANNPGEYELRATARNPIKYADHCVKQGKFDYPELRLTPISRDKNLADLMRKAKEMIERKLE